MILLNKGKEQNGLKILKCLKIRRIESIMALIYNCVLFGGSMVHDELEKMNTLTPKMKGQGAQKYKK